MAEQRTALHIDGITDERLVRRGDHTELYCAVQQRFGRKVAVKLYTAQGVRDTALARFERECALMGELSNHPHVVTYFGSGVRRRVPYVISEWLDEGTYSSRLQRGIRPDWAETADIGIKVAGALESAHRLGLVHRKLKPEDLFVSPFGEPLVGDFQVDVSEVSRSGDPYDIMVHAAPELFRGGASNPMVDVYALASVLYTLILGHPPFLVEADEPLVRIKGRALSSPPPDLRTVGVPGPLYAVLAWGLTPDPGRRPAGAQLFGRALQAALSAAGRSPARMLVRPQTDADRRLAEPTLPAAAMALLTNGRPAVAGGAPRPPAAPVSTTASTPPPPPGAPTPPVPPAGLGPPTSAAQPAPAPAPADPRRVAPYEESSTPAAVVEQVRGLLRLARHSYVEPSEIRWLDEMEARLDEPLRVAIVGKVKAGKSTLLNGLVGEELAPTDASECTRIITWYVGANSYAAALHLADGRVTPTSFSRQSGAIDVDLQGHPAESVDHVVIEWPSSSLTELTLVDTPGIASISTAVSERTHRFVLAERGGHSQADAVVYLMRHLHPTDVRFLESFQDMQIGGTNPINAIGVLSRADELAGGHDDALVSASRVAARYRSSAQVRRLCQTVVPVAGLLAQAAATLRPSEHSLISRLAGLPEDELELLLASADRFVDDDLVANVVSTDRAQLVRRLGLYGVRHAVRAVRKGTVGDAEELAEHLFEMSGLAELRRVLVTQFAARRDVLKAQAVLIALTQRLRSTPPPTGADRLQFELERLRSSTHVFAEIELFAAIRTGTVPFADHEVDAVERLLGAEGYSPATRLGLPSDAGAAAIRTELDERIQAWRARAENPLSSRELSDAAQVIVRSCEGMLRAMQVRHAV